MEHGRMKKLNCHTEKCGEDSLVAIFSTPNGYDTDAVVRWCYKCGAVVVDVDYDGRIKIGGIMHMRFPENNYA